MKDLNINRNDNDYIEIERILRRLRSISSSLSVFGILILASMIVNLILMGLSLSKYFHMSNFFVGFLVPFFILLAIASLFLPIIFDMRRRMGDSYFEEISNYLDSKLYRMPEERGNRLYNKARRNLRKYTRSADLPLIPGKFGPAMCFIINSVALTITFVSFFSRAS